MRRTMLIALAAWLVVALALSATGAQVAEEPPAPQPSNTVHKILDEAIQLTQSKQWPEALQAADRALAAAQETGDPVGEACAQRLRALALESMDRREEAVATWREMAAAWERLDDGPGQVEALAAAALLLATKTEAESDQLFAQALAVGQRESKRPLAAAQAFHTAGKSTHDLGRLNQAGEFYAAALAIRERLAPNSLDAAASLNALGTVAREQGDYVAAAEYLRRSLAIQEKLAPESLPVAVSLNELGILARAQANFDAAAEYHRRALTIHEKLAPNSLDMAATLQNLGVLTRGQGYLETAREYFRQALAIRERLAPNSLDVAFSLNGLGILARLQGDYTAAAEYHRRALAIRETLAPNSLDLAGTLHGLGKVAQSEGNSAAAKDYFHRALAIQEKLAPNSLGAARSLIELGNLAINQGDLAAAEEYHRRALGIEEKVAPNSIEVSRNLTSLGVIAYDRGNFAAAAEYHQQALAIREKLAPASFETANSLYHLALVTYKQGDLAAAERLAGQAWELVRQQAAAVTGDEARQAFGALTAEYAAALMRFQLALGKSVPALITLEEGRAQSLQQILAERHLDASAVDADLWSAYQAAIAALDRAERAVSRASMAESLAQRELVAMQEKGAAPQEIERAQAALKIATKQFEEARSAYTLARVKADQLWADIKKRASRAYAPPLTLEQAQQALPAGTLFVAFSTGQEQTHVFLLRSASDAVDSAIGHRPSAIHFSLSAYTVAVTLKELRALVDRFRAQVTKPSRRTVGAMASRVLFATLFPGKARQAVESAERLLISPDGPLWEVSFAALVTNAIGPPHYLGADKAISYTQSLTLFAQSRNDAPQLTKGSQVYAVVVGHPAFHRQSTRVARVQAHAQSAVLEGQGSRSETLDPRPLNAELRYLFSNREPTELLPETNGEALEIAKLYGGELLTEEGATEAELRARIERADVIHLATHGYLNPARAMSSGVLLTAPEKELEAGETANDGALQAWEIYSQLKLKAELVVLSACETGRGENVRGEGIIGLTRALQYAGARSIVASQWKVPDKSTSKLMVAFHRHLRQGAAKDEALRRAMAVVRQNKGTAHPYFWAAFALIGDPSNPTLGTAR
ncbi:MAG: CHAT domain-containing protein [Acidobacteria bacterium]|nr:CHAT domain-containing protein [Acidobacteriota bacterium]